MKKLLLSLAVALFTLGAHAQVTATTDGSDYFSFSVKNVNWCGGEVTVTPKDPDMKYYFYSRDMAYVSQTFGDDWSKVFATDRSWYEYIASVYGGTVYENWAADLVTGTKTFKTTDNDITQWGGKIVVYAYAIDDNANITTPMCLFYFDTTKPNASANTFDVKINEVHPNSVAATVTPSNNDPYVIDVQKKKFVDWYINSGISLDSMTFVLAQSQIKNLGEIETHNGTYTMNPKDWSLNSPGTEYEVIVYGFDNGLSTPDNIAMAKFTTLRGVSTVSSRFARYFVGNDGKADPDVLTAADNEEGAYYYTLLDEETPCSLLQYMTAIDAQNTESYTYTYNESQYDSTAKLTLTGSCNADAKGVYATMNVDMTDYPDIKKIYFVGTATGINGVNVNRPTADAPVYRLDGTAVHTAKANLTKGVYIQGGKKFVVK